MHLIKLRLPVRANAGCAYKVRLFFVVNASPVDADNKGRVDVIVVGAMAKTVG